MEGAAGLSQRNGRPIAMHLAQAFCPNCLRSRDVRMGAGREGGSWDGRSPSTRERAGGVRAWQGRVTTVVEQGAYSWCGFHTRLLHKLSTQNRLSIMHTAAHTTMSYRLASLALFLSRILSPFFSVSSHVYFRTLSCHSCLRLVYTLGTDGVTPWQSRGSLPARCCDFSQPVQLLRLFVYTFYYSYSELTV